MYVISITFCLAWTKFPASNLRAEISILVHRSILVIKAWSQEQLRGLLMGFVNI